MASQSEERLIQRLSCIQHIVLVLSGKGGVGKSSVSVQLALSLLANNPSARVGLLDIDLTGPSLPRMLGLQGQDVHASDDGWVPVYLDARGPSGKGGVLACMSIGFLLKNTSESVVWRGPKKNAMIKQFLGEVRWGQLDYLIVDTPPGKFETGLSLSLWSYSHADTECHPPLLRISRHLGRAHLSTGNSETAASTASTRFTSIAHSVFTPRVNTSSTSPARRLQGAHVRPSNSTPSAGLDREHVGLRLSALLRHCRYLWSRWSRRFLSPRGGTQALDGRG